MLIRRGMDIPHYVVHYDTSFPKHPVWHILFFLSAVISFLLSLLISAAVCQKQISVPNNSLLYCSEKCKRQDALSSSPPPVSVFQRSRSCMSDFQTNNSTRFTSFEPSRKEQWGITPSPILETSPATYRRHSQDSTAAGIDPMAHHMMRRGSFARPLPPLHPRAYGSSPRGMELVLPVYPKSPKCPPGSATSESKNLDYGRRIVEENTANSG